MDYSFILNYISFPDDKVSCFFVKSDDKKSYEIQQDLLIESDYELKNANMFSSEFKGIISTVDMFSSIIMSIILIFISIIFYNTSSIVIKDYHYEILILLREGGLRTDIFLFFFKLFIISFSVSVINALCLFALFYYLSDFLMFLKGTLSFIHFITAIFFSLLSLILSLFVNIIRVPVRNPYYSE